MQGAPLPVSVPLPPPPPNRDRSATQCLAAWPGYYRSLRLGPTFRHVERKEHTHVVTERSVMGYKQVRERTYNFRLFHYIETRRTYGKCFRLSPQLLFETF